MKPFSLLLLLVLAVCAGICSAQTPAALSAAPLDREALRKRWNALDDDDKALYRERFAKLADMRADERLALEERAAEIEQQVLELRDELPADLQRRLSALSPQKCDEIVHEFFRERQRSRGAHVREQLPPEIVEELEAAPPEERAAILRRFHDDMRRRAANRVLDGLPPDMPVPPEERERIEGLDGRERMRAVLELKRAQLRRRVEAQGPPPDLGDATWRELDALPLEDFFRAWGDRRRAYRELGPGGPLGGIRVDHPSAPRPWEHRGMLFDRLIELARPSLEDLIELADLSARERRALAHERARARCEEFLAINPLVPPDEAARIQGLSDREYLEELRAYIARQLPAAWGRFVDPAFLRERIDGLRGPHGGRPPGAKPPERDS